MANDLESVGPTAPAVTGTSVARPPHPLDAKYHIHQNDEVYGPYTGHDLKSYAAEGIIDGMTNVLRQGNQAWTKAAEDPTLAKIFHHQPPAPPPSITAGRGATVVQITNQIGTSSAIGAYEEGPFGPKSAGMALLLSLLICGGGQMYNGQVGKGVLMLIGCVFLWFFFLGWIINLWSWIDAYQTAKKMNDRYRRRLAAGMPVLSRRVHLSLGGQRAHIAHCPLSD